MEHIVGSKDKRNIDNNKYEKYIEIVVKELQEKGPRLLREFIVAHPDFKDADPSQGNF
jgi:hypothetical protein